LRKFAVVALGFVISISRFSTARFLSRAIVGLAKTSRRFALDCSISSHAASSL
jgi:hypothetical protein